MDIKKQTNKNLKPIVNGLFTLPPYGKEGPHLIGGFCAQCNRKFFPSPFVCPYCLSELKKVLLSNHGTLYSFTVVRVKAPFGLPLPYCLGYVDLREDGLRILSLIDPKRIEDLEIGMNLELHVKEIGDDGKGNPSIRYMFTPKIGKRQ